MKINDLDHITNTSSCENDWVDGGIQIEALTLAFSVGDSFALARTFSFTWTFAPGPFGFSRI